MTSTEIIEEFGKSSARVKNRRKPLVSFLMTTFGRCCKQPEMLNEAVWWCLNQDYPNVEVLVLNDAPNQKVRCADRRVRVINWPEKLPDLGTKVNLANCMAAGSICCPIDDDDISLPNRASQAVKYLRGFDYWKPGLWLYAEKNKTPVIDGNGWGHTSSAFYRDALLGNHPKAINTWDIETLQWAEKNLRINSKVLTDGREVSFVYRWGVSPFHLSGHGDPTGAYANNNPGRDGDYEIIPAMLEDWAARAAEAASR